MAEAATTRCLGCQRLQAQVEALTLQLQQLQSTVAHLQEQLAAARKNSSTSSKPPSSDIVKPPAPPPPPGQGKRKRGGQPGHPKHERALFPPEQVSSFFEHLIHACPGCGGRLSPSSELARIVQQVDMGQVPLTVEQHTSPEYWCGHCEKAYRAAMPGTVEKGGLLGPRLTVLVAYLKGVCHASYSTIRKFLRDVVAITISRGQLAKVIAKVSEALDGPYQELLEALPGQAVLNVDETGHKDQGNRMWTWCFRAELYTLFKIDPKRSADVLIEVLGKEFDGVLGCDCFSAYRRYMGEFDVRVQFCLAHLIRDVKFLTTLPDFADVLYGERLRLSLKSLFEVIHRREQLPADVFTRRLQEARDLLLRLAQEHAPATRHGQNLARRLARHGMAYFTFLTTPGVEPTNNLAEQAIRFVVLDRVVTQGTRGEAGQRWSERIWTVVATCGQQGRSVFEYLRAAVQAYFDEEEAPTLLVAGEG
jgi:transposase